MTEQQTLCRNCDDTLTGEYCSTCGQREGRGDIRFSDLASEVLGDFLHWDSRVWRTFVPLLFKPGFLTSEFIAGRRARYLPPVRLYLVISFVLFLFISISAGEIAITPADDDPIQSPPAQSSMAQHEADPAPGATAADSEVRIDIADEDSPAWLKSLEERMTTNVREIQDEPQDFVERLLDYLPQMMFMMLPVFAGILWLMYALSPFHYLQHLVFSLHFHSFAFLINIIDQTAERVAWHIDGMIMLIMLIYLPLALRRTYGSSLAAAIGKSAVIYLTYLILVALAFALMTVLVVVYWA
jgi:Protein of unknown function (DUF3667)